MHIQQNISLKQYNTFGIDVTASHFVEVSEIEELRNILSNNTLPLLILGGGSNILLTQNFKGLVIKNNFKGIDIIKDDADSVFLKVGAGENWHQFVMYCIDKGYCGIENLSLIPGNVGASPMQNIGAYGVEVKDVITEVEAINIQDYTSKHFSNKECDFGYRTSIFKTVEKGNYFITSVIFQLSKKPKINTSYGAIEDELKKEEITHPTIKDVSDAVIRIRQSKLPDPDKIGNSGSFFKNPVVNSSVKDDLLISYPSIPNYPQNDGTYKIAAGWLIEQCGWKGKTIDKYGVHSKQALVLVNHGGANGAEIYKLSEDIIKSVQQKFNITLEREVNII